MAGSLGSCYHSVHRCRTSAAAVLITAHDQRSIPPSDNDVAWCASDDSPGHTSADTGASR